MSDQSVEPGPSRQFTDSQVKRYRAATPPLHVSSYVYSDEEGGSGMKVRPLKRVPIISPPPPQRRKEEEAASLLPLPDSGTDDEEYQE